MGDILTNEKIRGDIGELIFEHFSEKNEYAVISLEEIYRTLKPDNKLIFRYGYERIEVKLPDDIAEEVRKFSRPTNNRENDPSFVYDFLTVSLKFSFKKTPKNDYNVRYHIQEPYITKKAFNWVEIKTGKGKLTKNQIKYGEETIIGLQVFRVDLDVWPNIFKINIESVGD